MVETLKKQWFVVLISLILIIFMGYIIWDTNKGKLAGKSVDGKDVVASITDTDVFADDVYDKISTQGGDDLLFAKFQDAVASQAIETTDDIKSEAKLQATSIEENFKSNDPTNYKTSIQTQLAQIGYDDLNDYCLKTTKVSKLQTAYIDANMDTLFAPLYEEKQSRSVAHILVKMEDSANPTEEELNKIKKIEDALTAGTSFADVAKEYSEDSSATNGGLLGYMDSDTAYVNEFKEMALSLSKDEVSDWVKVASSNYQGWHKIKVIETDKAALLEDEDTKKGIYSAIMTANANLAKKIVWEKSKELDVTFANDDVKNRLMKYMGIEEEEAK